MTDILALAYAERNGTIVPLLVCGVILQFLIKFVSGAKLRRSTTVVRMNQAEANVSRLSHKHDEMLQ